MPGNPFYQPGSAVCEQSQPSPFDIFTQLCKCLSVNTTQAKARADILKALAHPTRILILEALSRGDRCVNDLRSLASTTLPTISRHLAQLKKVGIVTERRSGSKIIHHLACPCMLQAMNCTCEVLKSVKKRQDEKL